MLIGRTTELNQLNDLYQNPNGQLVVIYGRRRIGKSKLIQEFCRNKPNIYIEGIEGGDTPKQIESAWQQVEYQTKYPVRGGVKFSSWPSFLYQLTEKMSAISSSKKILVLDELQWLAVRKGSLVSEIKYFWDNHWKDSQIYLILCGSITSYMINKVVKSKALYGRANHVMHLEGLLPNALSKFAPRRSSEELLKYQLTLGSVPKYLEEINPKLSFEKNINNLFFKKNSLFKDEYERIFYSQFPEYRNYQKIIELLATGPKSHSDLSQLLSLRSGGGLTRYLKLLQDADFIDKHLKFKFASKNSIEKYYISDPYLSFYFKYVKPNLNLIKNNSSRDLFTLLIKPKWQPWLGQAFENFCRRHALLIAEKLGFVDSVMDFGQVIQKIKDPLQIDLAYQRSDNVITLCEVKFHDSKIDADVIAEIERKKALIKTPKKYTIETALISLRGPSIMLERTEYLNYSLLAEEIIK